MLLLDDPTFLTRLFGHFSYLAPFVVLLLCGVGLPLPEEVTLIGAGLLLHRGEVEFIPIVLVCSTAIILGDSIPFFLGRRFGMRALEIPWVRRRVHPRLFRRIRKQFAEHGTWATFACRFFAGVRIPGYFVAGSMGMGILRFAILDVVGVLLSVPISIYIGKLFAEQVDEMKQRMHDLHLVLAFIALSLVMILVLRSRWLRRPRRTEDTQTAEAPEAGEDRRQGPSDRRREDPAEALPESSPADEEAATPDAGPEVPATVEDGEGRPTPR